jgi:hypothetical protein
VVFFILLLFVNILFDDFLLACSCGYGFLVGSPVCLVVVLLYTYIVYVTFIFVAYNGLIILISYLYMH